MLSRLCPQLHYPLSRQLCKYLNYSSKRRLSHKGCAVRVTIKFLTTVRAYGYGNGRPTKRVPKVEIENERTSNTDTPSAASKRTSHATDEACTILADLEDNAPNPKRKQRRKAGKKSTQMLSGSQLAPTGEILMCVHHDRLTHDVTRAKLVRAFSKCQPDDRYSEGA